MNWLLANKEWIFSGIGVALLGLLYAVFFRPRSIGASGQVSADRQSSMTGSPLASGSNISQTVNIVTMSHPPTPGPDVAYSETPSPYEIKKQLLALPVFQRKAAASSYLGLRVRWKGTLLELDELWPHYNKVASSGDATHDLYLLGEDKGGIVKMYVNIERFPRLKISHEGTGIQVSGTIGHVSESGAVRLKDADITF